MEIFWICLAAFSASILTFFSGYGLGTILLPVFSLFFPLDVSVAMTAVVHLLNNLFKVMLIGRNAEMPVVYKFGIPSLIAAFAGAFLLVRLSTFQPVFVYEAGGKTIEVLPVKLTIGVILLLFSVLEWIPLQLKKSRSSGMLAAGGLLSGFFGGLTGNQGALRTAFLMRLGLAKEKFIATGVVIACMVDVARIFVYSGRMESLRAGSDTKMIVLASLSAFAGAWIGNRLLSKITLKALQIIVTILLILYSVLLMAGLI